MTQMVPAASAIGSTPAATAADAGRRVGSRPVNAGVEVAPAAGASRLRAVTAYAQLSGRVQQAGLMRRRYGYYWAQMVGMAAAFAGIWVAFVLLGDSWWQLTVAAALAGVVTQFGFLGHDGAHRQIFASARWNEWSARLMSGVFAGLSYGWWSHKHNRHHNAPNQEGKDPDIAPGPLAFTPAVASTRSGLGFWFTRHQGYLFFPLLLLEGANLHLASVRTLIQRPELKHRRLELVLIVVRLGSYVTALFLVLPPDKALAFLAVQQGLFGLFLGGSFAPNHKGMPIVPHTAKVDFLRRQVLMSRNINGGVLTDFAMGGLNYQIEHHLFPSMPRPNLKKAQPIVRAYCHEQKVGYAQTSLGASYRIVIRYLNAVGTRDRDPFSCPLIQQYRG